MTTELATGQKRLTQFWFSTLSAPLQVAIAIALLVAFADFTAPMMLLPTDQLYMGAFAAMALLLVCARPLRDRIMVPSVIAARRSQQTPGASTTEQAITSTQTRLFMLLCALDAVPTIVMMLSLMQADVPLALLNGVYTLALAVIAKPDFAQLLRDVHRAQTHPG